VAVAGSVTGALVPGEDGSDPRSSDSFVSVFDAGGSEIWTQRRGARAADEATSVAFGADGRVYVAGRSQSSMPGAGALGGWDGYVQAFTESQVHSLAPVTAASVGTAQFGGSGNDGVEAVAVDGASRYTAGVESGRLVVRRFDLGAGPPVLAATRDLGPAGGEVAGLAIIDGKVMISGATTNAALDAGLVTTPHHGGRDAFVALIDGSLTGSAEDRLTYLGGADDDTVADVKVHDGKVWITGVAGRPAAADPTEPTSGYLARLDPVTGAVEWRRDWRGDGQQADPLALAVAAGGASILDRLGLPMGALPREAPAELANATSLRVGDRFYISAGEGDRAVAVTIQASDTLQSLARKIELASGRRLKAQVVTERATNGESGLQSGLQRLSITATDGRAGAVLIAGEAGRDALAGLGLSPGYVKPGSDKDGVKAYGLDLPRSLHLDDPGGVKEAQSKLQLAMTAVRSAYRALSPEAQRAPIGPAPAYLTAKIASYQAALARLGG
jgi:hypothetical protein